MTRPVLRFGFGVELDGRELYVTAETGNTAEELRTGRMPFGFGWEATSVQVDVVGGELLDVAMLEAHRAELERRALEAAVDAAVDATEAA